MNNSPDNTDLAELEEGGITSPNAAESNELSKIESGNDWFKPGVSGKDSKRNLAKKFLRHKGLLVAGGFASLIFLILMFLAGSLLIPNFVQNVTAYQFARVTRQMAQNVEQVTAEKLAIDAAVTDTSPVPGSVYKSITDKYANTTGKVKDTWDKLQNKYKPTRIIQNLRTDNTLRLNYVQDAVYNKPRLAGITLGNRSIIVKPPGFFLRNIPGLQFAGNVSLATDVAPVLKQALKANDIGPIIRSQVASSIRKELGISLIAWKIGEFRGKTPSQVDLQVNRDIFNVVNESVSAAESGKSADISAAVNSGTQTLQQDVSNDGKLRKILANNGVDPSVINAVDKVLNDSILKDVLGAISPIYGVAVPVCLVYDGSVVNNGPTMNAQNAELQRTYYYVASAADQQKNGNNANADAISALSNKLGDISQSNSEIRAGGGQIDTSGYPSPQASPTGMYSIADALLPGGSVVDSFANTICPVATNTWVGIGLGGVNIAGCLLTGGAACLGEKAAADGAKTILGRLAGRIVDKFASDQAAKKATALGGMLTNGIKDLGKTIKRVSIATIMARAIVYARMNSVNNGLQSGTDFANAADAGGNLAAGSISRQALFGRPLNGTEVALDQVANQQYLASLQQQQNPFNRYLAISNSNSLVARVGSMLSGHLNASIFSSLLSITSNLFNPLKSIGTILSHLDSKVAFADALTAVNANYGNVQWGFSADEQAVMQNDPTYQPLENQKALDDSKQEVEIAQKYAKCFGYMADSNGNLTPDPSKQVGDLIASGDIPRDTVGNITSGDGNPYSDNNLGLCTPSNLGLHNPVYGERVFRWRVAQTYNNTMDQLINLQDVTK